MIVLYLLSLILSPIFSSAPSLDFYHATQVITIPSKVSTSLLQLSINPTLPEFDEALLDTNINKILKHINDANLNLEIKSLINNLKDQFTYLKSLLEARKTNFVSKDIPTPFQCMLNLAILPDTAAQTTQAISGILAQLSPETLLPGDKTSVKTENSQLLIGTILPFSSVLSTLIDHLDNEFDMLQSLVHNVIPPYFFSFLANAPCMVPALENRYVIKNTTKTKTGLITTIEATQILTKKSYQAISGTPFKSWILNLSSSEFPLVLTSDNTLIYLNCSQNYTYCQEQNYDMSCIQALHNRNFIKAKTECTFIPAPNYLPTQIVIGILIPGPAEYTVGTGPSLQSTELPSVIQPNAKLQVKFKSVHYNFGSKFKEITTIIPFIFSESDANRLIEIIENPFFPHSFTLIEKILLGISTGVVSLLVSILACGMKSYTHVFRRTPDARPHVVFRVAARKP